MATLPTGWEWDYDGSRWLYRYKPTGHVQYHFPSAGDEFPDYIDVSSPAPDLAPEERLESQQQVKRHASVSGTPGRAPAEDRDGWRSRMSATAQPVSVVWDDDFGRDDEDNRAEVAEEEGVFQPENFMFLGPGTYTDVSPLVEEEEEAARRIVVGGERNGGQQTQNRGVSPMVSQTTTPMVQTSETVTRGPATVIDQRAVEPPLPPPIIQYQDPAAVVSPQEYITGHDIVGEASAPTDGGYSYDMFELPAETASSMRLQFDPVGTVPEMPTEYTAASRAETNPDPIELADNYVMAPIETEPRPGFVELPAEVMSSEEAAVREERWAEEQKLELRRQEVRRRQEERQREVKQRQEERKRREEEELQSELRRQQQNEAYSPTQEQSSGAPTPFKITRKPTLRGSSTVSNAYAGRSQQQDDYQAYAPVQAPQQTTCTQPTSSFPARIMSPALQRETSLNMSMRPSTASAPPVDQRRVPSVLKPARNGSPRNSGIQQQTPVQTSNTSLAPQGQKDAVSQDSPGGGVVKYPSVLRPARGKPGQSLDRQAAVAGSQQGSSAEAPLKDARASGYQFVPHGQHPPSMTPAPGPVPVPTPAPAPVVQQYPPQNPPAPAQQDLRIAAAQPLAPIQRSYTTALDLPQSNLPISQQYAAPPIPLKVAAEPPYPTEPLTMPHLPVARNYTAPYPHDDAPPMIAPYGPLQRQQPTRPASAMPVLQHQRREPTPGAPQQIPIRTGPPPSGAVIVPAGMAPRSATAGPTQQLQQQRWPSYQPGGDARQNVSPAQNSQPPRPQSVAYPGVYANFASYQSPPPQPRPIQRRATQDEIPPVSPIRSRSESLSSGAFPLETPSPIESRRGSVGSFSSQNARNSYFASTPSSQGSSSVPPSNGPMGRPPTQEPPQSPVSSGASGSDVKLPYIPAVAATQDRSKRHSMPQQQLANVMQGSSQELTSPHPHAQMQPSPDQRPGGVQRSQSLRQANLNTGSFSDVPNQMGPQSPTVVGPSSSSRLLNSIEEHDETQHGAAAASPLKMKQRKVLTKPPPHETPASPPNRGGPQQQFIQGAPASAPLQTTGRAPQNSQQQPVLQDVLQGQGMPVQQQVAPRGQQLAYGPALHMHIPPQPAPVVTQGGPIMRPGQIQSHAMPMQGFQPLAQHAQPQPQQYQLQQPPQQQPQQRMPQALPTSPSATQPAPLPPLQTPQQTSPTSSGKENRKSWGKWFKSSGSKSAAQSPVAQQPQQSFPPVPIPQPLPGANQFGLQAGGQQFPMGFQGGQPVLGSPLAQQQPQYQQIAPHRAPFAGQGPPEVSPLPPGGSALHRRDVSDAGSVSTISSDLRILPSSSQTFAQAPVYANAGNSSNDPSLQHYRNDMAPAPLFSGGSASKQPFAASQGNKWTGKSPVDYSGGDWGSDDDEFS
ncbi:hypothetical protein J3F83DRAFT_724875 [Trichoderma novae-zelandiae]